MEGENGHSEETNEDWVMLRRDDVQQLVAQIEALESLVSVDAAPACDDPPCSGDDVMMTVDLAG